MIVFMQKRKKHFKSWSWGFQIKMAWNGSCVSF